MGMGKQILALAGCIALDVASATVTQSQVISPDSIVLGESSPVCQGGSDPRDVSVLLPPETIKKDVDVFLLFDDTGSFANLAPQVQALFSALVVGLQAGRLSSTSQ